MKKLSTLAVITSLITTHAYSDGTQPPTGSLSVNKNIVTQNEKPRLSWEIVHPTTLEDVIEVGEDDEVEVLKKLKVDIYMVGTGVTSHQGSRQYTTISKVSFNHGAWQQIFKGKGKDVNPSEIQLTRILKKGDSIRFKAKYDTWRNNESEEVIILTNGDAPPVGLGQNGGVDLEDYLSPYVKNGKLDLGPLDFIYCAELTHTNQNSSGYDLQDSIVLVRFTEVD